MEYWSDGTLILHYSNTPKRSPHNPNLNRAGGLAVDRDFDVMIQVIVVIAVAVKAHVTTLHAFGIDQAAFGGFHIMLVRARAHFRRVVDIIVIHGGDIRSEIGII